MNDKVAKEIDVVLRLHDVKCPNDCVNGFVYRAWTETVMECCGNVQDNGECCNDPVPFPGLITQTEQCAWCYELSNLKEKNEVDNNTLQDLIKAAK